MPFTPIFETGWEHKTTASPTLSNNPVISATQYKTGAVSLALGNEAFVDYELLTPQADLYYGAWMRHDPLISQITIQNMSVVFYEATSAGEPIRIKIVNNKVEAYVNGVLVATGTQWIPLQSFFNLQIHIVVGNSGSIVTKVDGIQDINYSGDTQIGANTTIRRIRMWSDTSSNYNYWDDVCWGTGDWPGARRYDKLTLNSDHAVAWTPSSAADHYTLVDEVPYSETDYVYATTSGVADLFGHSGWTGANKIPVSLVEWIAIKKQDADSSQFKFVIHEGANTLQSAATSLLTSTQVYGYSFTTAADGSALDETHTDATIFGVESVI